MITLTITIDGSATHIHEDGAPATPVEQIYHSAITTGIKSALTLAADAVEHVGVGCVGRRIHPSFGGINNPLADGC